MKYFTVDRSRRLYPGFEGNSIVDISNHPYQLSNENKEALETFLNEGLSVFGVNTIMKPFKLSQNISSGHPEMDNFYSMDHLQMMAAREMIFELFRKSCHPDKPSRLQSLFCFESHQEAVKFKAIYGDPESKIYQIEAEKGFTADMNCLSITESFLDLLSLAEKYWSGKPKTTNDEANWETLVIGKFTILEGVS
jgi:hypothetical protein